MNNISQISIFEYSEIENLGDLERLNGRIDRDYMFNDHFIRGQKKMELMLNLTFIVMLTIAKGHIKNKQENIRSLVV